MGALNIRYINILLQTGATDNQELQGQRSLQQECLPVWIWGWWKWTFVSKNIFKENFT